MFKEFIEFTSPEKKDYDLRNQNLNEVSIQPSKNERKKLVEELINIVGFLEDGEWINYGITEEEYMNPSKETINKVKKVLNSNQNNYKTK